MSTSTVTRRKREPVSAVEIKTTVPLSLARQLEELIALDSSTEAATVRRLIARGVAQEKHGGGLSRWADGTYGTATYAAPQPVGE